MAYHWANFVRHGEFSACLMPVPLAKKTTRSAGVAQSVEQRTRNAKVVGSIPISGTTQKKRPASLRAFCLPTPTYD